MKQPFNALVHALVYALCSLVLITLFGLGHAQAPRAVIEARQSAVGILRPNRDGELRQVCSGAVVALPQGPRVLSAGHCLVNGDRFYVRDGQNRLYEARTEAFAKSYESDPPQDYAVLSSVAQWLLPALEPSPHFPELGAEVWAWSAPQHIHPLLLVRGMYLGDFYTDRESNLDGLRVVELNSDNGSSGSVLLDGEGKALAIVTLHFDLRTKFIGTVVTPLPIDALGGD